MKKTLAGAMSSSRCRPQISGAPAEVAFVTMASVVTITTSGQTATGPPAMAG